MNTKEADGEKYIDSLGQENPAVTMERANLLEAKERTEKSVTEEDKPGAHHVKKPVDYESMTVPELRELAEKRKVHVSGDMRKDEIIRALEKAD